MSKTPTYTFAVIARNPSKRKKFLSTLQMMIDDLMDIGDFEQASVLARQRKRVIEEIELLTGGKA